MNSSLEREKDKIIPELLDELSDGLIVYHNIEGIVWCNQGACQIIGKESDQIIGRNIKDILPGLDNKKKNSQMTLHPGSPAERNLQIKLLLSPVGSLKTLIVKDMTLQFKNQIRMDEFSQKYKNYEEILNSLDHGIIVADNQGIITFYNPVQAKTDQMQADNVIGRHITDIYQLGEESSFLLRALKTGKTIDERQDYITSSGKLVNVITTATPLWREDTIIGAVAITNNFDSLWEIFQKDLDIKGSSPEKQALAKAKITLTNSTKYSFQDIVGQNKQLCHAKLLAVKAAGSLSPVLVYGETGTGKELFVQSIHQASSRAKKPFIAINCAAIPENLLEGLLFGTVPGAFTGAVNRAGLFEQAAQGTIFLDEVNSMPLALQAKLLRVIQEGVARRVGGIQDYQIDVRLISSCNEHPMTAISNNTLRSDLFYRIGVINIAIPPLRERKDDLPLLVDYFIHKKNEKLGKSVIGNAPAVEAVFYQYDWPGNVRQLEHVIESAMHAMGLENRILIEHLPEYVQQDFPRFDSPENIEVSSDILSLADQLEQVEMNRIIEMLKDVNGNVSQAAKQLCMSRQCLQYRMKKYQININRMVNG